MTKTKKTVRPQKDQETFFNKFSLEEILPVKYHPLAVILVIIILFLIFLNPLYFGNKTFQSGDILASKSLGSYINNHKEGFTLWNPLIFCGMPAYALGTSYLWFNLIYVIYTAIRDLFTSLFAVPYTTWTFFLILLAFNSYLVVKHITKNTLVSLFTGLTTAFSTGIIVFLYIGHVTKLTTLCMFPLILLMLLRLKDKIRLIDFLILIVILQIMLQGFHPQIIFYILLAVAIYFIYFFIRHQVKKEFEVRKKLVKSAALFAVSLGIALLIQADNITQIYEYTQFSTRGTKSVVEQAADKSDASSSEYYEYHTNWSFSPEEVLTFIIPSFEGFGYTIYKGPLSNNQPVDVNLYIGQMPFVDVAMYMGVIVFFLTLFAVFTRWEEPLVQFLAILSGISILISFGRTFPLLFDLLFYYLPLFNKFRVPSMILVIPQMCFPILAGFGLMKIISLKENFDQKALNILKYFTYGFTIVFVFGLLFNGSLTSWFAGRVNDYASSIETRQSGLAQQYRALAVFAGNMFSSDFMFGFALLSLAFWSAIAYLKKKLSKDIFIALVILFAMIDLLRIDARGAEPKYIDVPDVSGMFKEPEYVKVIKKQNDSNPFRILNLKQDGSLGSFNNNSNYNSYFMLEDFYGYSGIKPRSYQDIMDVIGPVNPTLWRMLNVKYIITNQAAQLPGLTPILQTKGENVYRNDNALNRAYFVKSIETKPALEILNLIKNNSFDPQNIAYVEDQNLKVAPPDSTASVSLTSYKDETVKYNVNASGNNFLFFGDTYIAGKADYKLFKVPTGWNAFIDGTKTKIYKTNHGFMGIIVPKGKHEVKFVYSPISFSISKYLVLTLSGLVILGLVISTFLEIRKNILAKSN